MTILIGIVVVLGIGLIDYAVCRMCSIYDKWSEQRELSREYADRKKTKKKGAMPSKHVSAIDGVDKTPSPFYQV